MPGAGGSTLHRMPNYRLPMASTTKIMRSRLLALEQPDLDEPFVVDSAAIREVGTSMGLKEGDTGDPADLGPRDAAPLWKRRGQCSGGADRREQGRLCGAYE